MNYYPADDGWTLMWTHYSHSRTVSDFKAIASLDANTVRVIVQPYTFGYPRVLPSMKSRFDDMLAVARQQHLSVQLSLFDLWGNYDEIGASKTWLEGLLSGHQNDVTIALVELRNEISASPAALSWAQAMLPELERLLPGTPRTLSIAGGDAAQAMRFVASISRADLNVIDIHFYGLPSALPALLSTAKDIAAGRPVIVGEVGYPTLPDHGTGGEADQADYFRLIAELVKAAGLPPFAPWVFSDFSSQAIPAAAGGAGKVREYHFGLRRLDGSWKPAAAVVRAMFRQ